MSWGVPTDPMGDNNKRSPHACMCTHTCAHTHSVVLTDQRYGLSVLVALSIISWKALNYINICMYVHIPSFPGKNECLLYFLK